MAALPETTDTKLVELRRVTSQDLRQVLNEEESAWKAEFDWDLRPSLELVRRFVDMQALNGFALLRGARLIGYSYFVCDEAKGLIGDLYVIRSERTPEHESALMEATVDALRRTSGVRRIEAQLLMLGSQSRPHTPGVWQRSYPRLFMDMPIDGVTKLAPAVLDQIPMVPWTQALQDHSARLIAHAYRGHVDSEINDQYRSPGGARRFLTNIIQYPGCGTFFANASYAAVGPGKSELCGMSLASLVAGSTGHITQICIAPEVRGMKLGYELLRRSLLALAAHGCRTVSLTVTEGNREAIRLYESVGFSVRHRFHAHVWDLR